MRSQILEARVLQVVDTVLRGDNNEDSRFELKAEWPSDHARAARQIAGLANAGSGEDVVWIIGIDEKAHALREVAPTELQNWWLATAKRFSEVAPELQALVVPTPSGESVVALAFDTSRAPYLITTDGKGGVEREIPWREGNATRSARRSEILRTVVDQSRTPQLELVRASLEFEVQRHHPGGWQAEKDDPSGVVESIGVYGAAVLFVETSGPAFLPEHRWATRLVFEQHDAVLRTQVSGPKAFTGASSSGMPRSEPRGAIEYIPDSGVSINGSDTMTASFRTTLDIGLRDTIEALDEVVLHCTFPVAPTTRTASITFRLTSAPIRPVDDYGSGNRGFKVLTHDGQSSKL